MGIRKWWRKMRRRKDAAAIAQAEQAATIETPEEEAELSQDRYDKGADEAAARLAGEASPEELAQTNE